jgi:hypothetical protein
MKPWTALFVMLHVAVPGTLLVAETAETLTVPAAKTTLHVAVPLPSGLSGEKSAAFRLVEIDHPDVTVPAQRIPAMAADGAIAAGSARLAASIPPRSARVSDPAESSDRRSPSDTGRPAVGPVARSEDRATAPGTRRFRIEATAPPLESAGFRFREIDDKSLALDDAGKPVLVYNYGVITNPKVPKNDPRRSRACFVNPVYGLSGEVLTESFPTDHYHHHGLFWAWPHIGIDGKEYDLWVDKDIRQRFVRWICREAGPVAAVLAVENGWFVGDKKVMIERVWLRAYKPAGGERSLDIEFALIPVDKPITLRGAEGKSYGGLNLRFAPRKDTVITVPSGRTKDDLPDTPLAWVDLTARFSGAPGPSGAAVFVDPKHPGFPPTWLTRHYGILCCGFPGVKGKTFPPGEPIRLDYRVWIHTSAVEVADLQAAFDGYGAGKHAVRSTQ